MLCIGEPHSVIGWLGRSDLTGDVVMWAGIVVLFAIPAVTFSTQNCWGWLMGPHSGLSLQGGTGYPAPHWNLELGTWAVFKAI